MYQGIWGHNREAALLLKPNFQANMGRLFDRNSKKPLGPNRIILGFMGFSGLGSKSKASLRCYAVTHSPGSAHFLLS